MSYFDHELFRPGTIPSSSGRVGSGRVLHSENSAHALVGRAQFVVFVIIEFQTFTI